MANQIPAIEIENLTRQFGDAVALDRVSVSIRKGEFFSLLGPSGCGKTTLLRCIAGLEIPTAGSIRVDGTEMAGVPAHRRPVNTVFQSYALFPHLTVAENIAFGLRMKKVPKAEIGDRVKRVMDMTEISALGARRPHQLSGGQRQRVALARAIVNEPMVLLLDEPLGALDLKLRKQLQVDLRELQRRLGITFVYVTHDQEEALVMSDRIAVMNAGRIEQLDDAKVIYEHPRTRYVSQFLGSCNLIEGTVCQGDVMGVLVRTPLGDLRVESPSSRNRERLTLAIRPEKVSLTAAGADCRENCVNVRVVEVIYIGAATHYVLQAGDLKLTAEAMNVRVGHQGFEIGQEAVAHLPAAGLLVLDD